jgi:hypothetical protein
MTSESSSSARRGILLLIAVNILAGLLIFRDYGYSWDEPLFYDYAQSLGYAYSPQEWLSGEFDLERSFGSSGDDHKTRGPAYLLLARWPASLLQTLGLDIASAWHLVNFLFFQLGIYFLYRLSLRWIRPSAALATAALFAWQPMLWGHAFINPKDPPFLVFFLASVCLGFEMVDRLSEEAITTRQKISAVILPAMFLGIATSIRVLGPLAGLLVVVYALVKSGRRFASLLAPFVFYAVLAIAVMFATWPFLWGDPVQRFLDVFLLMSDNPTTLSVLFEGEVYRAGELPRRYLPFMLATTLTEPVLPLCILGVCLAYARSFKDLIDQRRAARTQENAEIWMSLRSSLDVATIKEQLASLTLILAWFGILLAYVLLRRPAMYDGLRHFLFILPPIFLFAGITFDFLMERLNSSLLKAVLGLILLAPGIAGMVQLHPYEYTYYNSYVGGTGGAFRQYETDYWLTCYREAVDSLEEMIDEPVNLYVHREGYIADSYANESITVHELRGARDEVQPGDYVLVNTRTNEDRRVFRDAPPVLQVGRAGALFCEIKQIP